MMADKTKTVRMLKIAKGQIDGIIKMMEENQYCVDISNQLLACQAILAGVNKQVLHAHLTHCVLNSTGEDGQQKVEEIAKILDKLL